MGAARTQNGAAVPLIDFVASLLIVMTGTFLIVAVLI